MTQETDLESFGHGYDWYPSEAKRVEKWRHLMNHGERVIRDERLC